MKVKTCELSGAALDWAVAVADEQVQYITFDHDLTHPLIISRIQSYGPSFIWSQGGPIIEQEQIELHTCPALKPADFWRAQSAFLPEPFAAYGPTPLVAAMRCFVASRLGDEVDVPEELLA